MAVIDTSQFAEMDAKFGDCMYKCWGPTLIFFPEDTDSSRMCMATSQERQFLTLLNPDVPRIQTGFENAFGKHNRTYLKLKGTWEVRDKIDKFGDGRIYTLVLYNPETDTYDMIEKVVAENRTERFGYAYNTSRMDDLEVGEVITDEVLSKSTSYDEHMNYRLGKNALVMYSTSNPTIEDAVFVRKGWADSVKFVEIDSVMVPANDNDIFLNLYGDENTYKPFPLVGEKAENSTLCATRRIVKDHLLYDFQSKNLRQANTTDTEYFVSKDAFVYDINVYYNGATEFPNNVFYKELRHYYECCQNYADRISAWGYQIKKSGSHYTDNVPYLRAKHMHVSDSDYKWKYKDREFSNILIEFKVIAVVSLQEGFKIVGRYGDKGVISRIANDHVSGRDAAAETAYIEAVKNTILDNFKGELDPEELAKMSDGFQVVEDSQMPYLDDGRKVDIMLNASGAIRRLNFGQIDEVDLNFQMEGLRRKICETTDMDEKYEILFKFLEIVNQDEYKFFYQKYGQWDRSVTIEGYTIRMLNQKAREEFMADVEKNGIYLVKPPHSNIRYDTVKEVYHTFPFLKPLPLYIDLFGIPRKRVMRDAVVGEKYMYVLKQTSNKNFSARSTGRVNKKGLPEKSTDKRDNRAEISHNPLKIGETYNLLSSISGEDLAEFNIFMRSSPIGRKSLKKILGAEGNPFKIHQLRLKGSYRNVNADILNAYMKSWGLRLDFVTDVDRVDDVILDADQMFDVRGFTVIDTPLNRPLYNTLFKEYEEHRNDYIIVETYPGEAKDVIWKRIFEMDHIKEMKVPDSIKDMCVRATKNMVEEPIELDEDDPEETDE